MHSFTTERLLIRPLSEQDKALYISLYTDIEIMRYITNPLTIDQATKSFHNTLKIMTKSSPKIMVWVIINLADNKLIGIQGLTWQKKQLATITKVEINASSTENQQVDLGIIITEKVQGMGFAQEAIPTLINYCFNYLLLDRVYVFFAKKNLPSKQLFNNLNFISDPRLQDNNIKYAYQYLKRHAWQHKHAEQVY